MTKLSSILTAGGLAVAMGFSAMQPAKADTNSTVDTALAAAAVIAGIAIESNVAHKNALANQIVGYTRNGATVYADGHVVLPNGQSYYPGNNGQTVACNGQLCTISGQGQTGYAPGGYYGNNNGYGNGYYGNNGNNGYYGNNGYANNGYGYNNNGYAYPASRTRTVTINRTVDVNRNVARNVIVERNVNARAHGRNERTIHVARDNDNRDR